MCWWMSITGSRVAELDCASGRPEKTRAVEARRNSLREYPRLSEYVVVMAGASSRIGVGDTSPRDRLPLPPEYRRAARHTAVSTLRLASRRAFRLPTQEGPARRTRSRR